MAMRTSTRSDGNLIVSVKNCDTSYNDETLLNVANATGEYTLDLQVSARSGTNLRRTLHLPCSVHERISKAEMKRIPRVCVPRYLQNTSAKHLGLLSSLARHFHQHPINNVTKSIKSASKL